MHPCAALVCCLFAAEASAPGGASDAGESLLLSGALPFTRLDLEQAIAVRLLEGSTLPGRVEVIAQSPHQIEVSLGGRRRVVDVGAATPEMVVRLVAISVADLLMETAPAPLRVPIPAPPPVREGPPPLRLTMVPGWGHGLQRGETSLYSLMVGVHARRGRWLAGVDVGYWHAPTERAGQPGESIFAAWPVRAGVALALRRFEFSLGPVLASYNVSGAVPRSGLLVGGAASAWAVWPLPRGLLLLAGLGCDLFANRTATTVGVSYVTFASPRVAPWAGAGLGWELGS